MLFLINSFHDYTTLINFLSINNIQNMESLKFLVAFEIIIKLYLKTMFLIKKYTFVKIIKYIY